jgi:transglutaminase-like putative cysteine protease
MAREPDTPAGRQRLVALAAVAALAVATAVAFGRVFIGHPPTQKLVLAALASVAVGALFERRSLALAVVATAVGLGLAITWLVFPQTTWFGVPTLRTLRALERSLDFVAQQARVQVAPAPPLPPLLLAALTAVWTASFSIHALAIRAGSPLLAVLPPVALVGFADTVLEDGARPTYALLFLAAVLAVVFVDGLRRVREWGPIWSSSRERRFGSSAMRGARLVGVVAVLAAVLIPGVLPGFRAAALVDLSTGNDDGIDLDPFVSIQNQLEQSDPVDLFQVTSPDGPAYWRLYALDLFDGLTWTSSDPLAKQGQVLSSPAQLSAGFRIDAPRLEQRIHILQDVDESWLPMAYPPESIVAPLESFRYDAELGEAVVDGGLRAGLEYSVTSRRFTPSPEELNAVHFNPGDYGTYTFIPPGIDPRIAEVAERWTEGLSTPYEQIYAIQQHFQSDEFIYDQTVEPVADNEALVNFFRSKRGFCQQFATAMALLVRELGYPARVAVGFREGDADAQGDTYTVTSKDAHAWVEVYFGETYGWLPFEPTPQRTNPVAEAGTYLNPSTPGESGETPTGPGAARNLGPDGTNADDPCGKLSGQLCNSDPLLSNRPGRQAGGGELPPGFFGPAIAAPIAEGDGYSIPYRWIGLGLLAVLLIAAIVVPIAKWTWRRRALRRSQAPRELVLAAVRVFDGEVADVGLGRRDGETLEEHRARLSATVAFSDGRLSRLTTAAMRAAYSPSEPSSADATEAVSDARTAASDVRRSVGIGRRLLGIYRPGM